MTDSTNGRKRVVFACEACGSLLYKRSSYRSHKFLRHDTYVCENPVCSASYSGTSELTHVSSPSGMPDAMPSELPPTPTHLRNEALRAWKQQNPSAQSDLFDHPINDPDKEPRTDHQTRSHHAICD